MSVKQGEERYVMTRRRKQRLETREADSLQGDSAPTSSCRPQVSRHVSRLARRPVTGCSSHTPSQSHARDQPDAATPGAAEKQAAAAEALSSTNACALEPQSVKLEVNRDTCPSVVGPESIFIKQEIISETSDNESSGMFYPETTITEEEDVDSKSWFHDRTDISPPDNAATVPDPHKSSKNTQGRTSLGQSPADGLAADVTVDCQPESTDSQYVLVEEKMLVDPIRYCEYCHGEFNGLRNMKRHVRLVHKSMSICKRCLTSFANAEQLQSHMETCTVVNPGPIQFTCEVCNIIFTRNTFLARHKVRFHSNLLCCNKCGKFFLTDVLLQTHVETCIAKRKKRPMVTCDICKKKMSCSTSLKKHKARIHNTQPICKKCQKVFESVEMFKAHKETCPKYTGSSSEMENQTDSDPGVNDVNDYGMNDVNYYGVNCK